MPSTFDTMVGKRIKKQRMEINYSQEQLAASTNCSYRCIQKWESGKTMPRAQMLSVVFASTLFMVIFPLRLMVFISWFLGLLRVLWF